MSMPAIQRYYAVEALAIRLDHPANDHPTFDYSKMAPIRQPDGGVLRKVDSVGP